MVNQDIVNYLKEGRRRGFSFTVLKDKLRQGGFSEVDIREATQVVLMVSQSSQIAPTDSKPTFKPALTDSGMSVADKVIASILHPNKLFANMSGEDAWSALKYQWALLAIPFFIASISSIVLAFWFRSAIPSQIAMLLEQTGAIFVVASIVSFAFISFVIIPVTIFLFAGIFFGASKLYEGQGDYAMTYKILTYSLTPGFFLIIISSLTTLALGNTMILFAGLAISSIWTLILLIVGTQTNHILSTTRSILAVITSIIGIVTLVTAGMMFYYSLQPASPVL